MSEFPFQQERAGLGYYRLTMTGYTGEIDVMLSWAVKHKLAFFENFPVEFGLQEMDLSEEKGRLYEMGSVHSRPRKFIFMVHEETLVMMKLLL